MDILLLISPIDHSYLGYLKSSLSGHNVSVSTKPISTAIEVVLACKKHGITNVITTNPVLLHKLVGTEKAPSLDNYAGSMFEKMGITILFIDPLKHFITVPYAKFLTDRYISKITKPQQWLPEVNFTWEILDASNADRIFNDYSTATIIAVDIETVREELRIDCVGYTAAWVGTDGSIRTHSCVMPIDSLYNLAVLRKFNWELQAPKVLQNGKYDISYLLRYNAPLYNYTFDTQTMFHCWYSELPKDLGFLGSFFVRRVQYWKDLAKTTDREQYFLYNCRDHWTTALAALAWIMESPNWAKQNYVMEFPLLFPCILSESTGLKRDSARLLEASTQIAQRIKAKNEQLARMVGWSLNVNSAPQMKLLGKILGLGDNIDSMDETALKAYSEKHPLNRRIFDLILDIRGDRKLKSTYLRTNDDITSTSKRGSKDFHGRILYSINPHGTDTGRNSSREHHFWCGLQIQNIPRGRDVKQTIVADDGFLFGECDLKQAETRDTAYISGDARLIAAVSGDKDFHSVNASAFFGVSYDSIFDESTGKTKDKKIRDLAKRVNHGANYCMGPGVLVDTMGLAEIESARVLLKLPAAWKPIKIAEHLLEQFHKTYSSLASIMYVGIWNEVLNTNKLIGATGWTRWCFSRPKQDNKPARNAYVAHVPQSLNAMVLNKSYMKVFYEIAMHPEHKNNFKLLAQIHDSILFQFREGHEYLCTMVQKAMEIPVTITSYDGIKRTFIVPADIKAGPDGKGAKYWSDTE